MKRAETSTGERTRPVSWESQGRILAVRSTSGLESQDLAEWTRRVGHERALLARVDADRLAVFQEQERRQRAARLDASGGDQLRRFENVERRKIAVLGLAFVDVGQGGVGGAEVDADLHADACTSALADVELQLPAAAVAGDAPELQHAGLGDHGFERDRHDFGRSLARAEAHFHRRELFEFVAEVFDQVAGLVVLAGGGGEEAELGGLADDQAELAIRE